MAKGKGTRRSGSRPPTGLPAANAALAFKRAMELHQRGQLDQAESLCREVLAIQPRHPDALHYLGLATYQRGHPELALAMIDSSLRISPGNIAAHINRGLALQQLGRLDESLASYDRALALKPRDAETLNNRGVVLQALGRLRDALASFDAALAIKPDYVEALNNRVAPLNGLNQPAEALASCARALAIRPDYAEALSSRGVVLAALNRSAEALASFDAAIAIKPDYADALYSRGVALQNLSRLTEALASYEQALAIRPADPNALSNRGVTLQRLNRLPEALVSLGQALAVRPGHVDANWNSSLAKLLLGDFSGGWEAYEWRWQVPALRLPVRHFDQPRLRGEEDLTGKTIFVYAEQGLGDTIQFCRYGPLLAARGARVVLEVQPPLKGLLGQLNGLHALLGVGETLPEFDLQCPLLSLPRVFRTDLASIPAGQRYLAADADRVAAWQARLEPRTRPRVGLVWAGSATHSNDENRSIPLPLLMQLADARGLGDQVQLISLQKALRPGDRELLAAHPEILPLGDELGDFSDTAALVATLDLLISVDTAPAHLAGALGKPVWILLPFAPDWRWLLNRDDSPWYPSARLFRQSTIGDWESVIGRVARELASRPGPK